jgi:hypothetical protein
MGRKRGGRAIGSRCASEQPAERSIEEQTPVLPLGRIATHVPISARPQSELFVLIRLGALELQPPVRLGRSDTTGPRRRQSPRNDVRQHPIDGHQLSGPFPAAQMAVIRRTWSTTRIVLLQLCASPSGCSRTRRSSIAVAKIYGHAEVCHPNYIGSEANDGL